MLAEQREFFNRELNLLETVEKCFCTHHRVQAPKPVLAIDVDQTLLINAQNPLNTSLSDASKITPGDFLLDSHPYPHKWLARRKISAQVLAALRRGLKVVVITQGLYNRDDLYERWQVDAALEEWQYQLATDNDHFFLLNAKNEELRRKLIENETCAEFFLEEYFSNHRRSIEELEKNVQESKTHLQSNKNPTSLEIEQFLAKAHKLQLRKEHKIFRTNLTIGQARQILGDRDHQEREEFIQNLLNSTTLMLITSINKKLILAFWLAIQGAPFNENTAKNIILVDDLETQNTGLTLYPYNKIKFVRADIIIDQSISEQEVCTYNPNYTYIEGIQKAIKELFSTSAQGKNFYEAVEYLSPSEIRNHIFECIPADCPYTRHFVDSHLLQAFAKKIAEMRDFFISLQTHRTCYLVGSTSSTLPSSSSSVENGTYKAIETCAQFSPDFLTESKVFYMEYTTRIKECVKGERKMRRLLAGFKTPEEMMKSKACRIITRDIARKYQPAIRIKKSLSDVAQQLQETALQAIPLIFDPKTEDQILAIQENFSEIMRKFFCPQLYEAICWLMVEIYKLNTGWLDGDEDAAFELEKGVISILKHMQNYLLGFLNGAEDNSSRDLLSTIDEISKVPILNERHDCIRLCCLCEMLLSCSCCGSPTREVILLQKLSDVCNRSIKCMYNAHPRSLSIKSPKILPLSLWTAPIEEASSTSSYSSQPYSSSSNAASVSTSVSSSFTLSSSYASSSNRDREKNKKEATADITRPQ